MMQQPGTTNNRHQRGFVLPSLLLVTTVLLLIATALLTSGTSSLRASTFDQQAEQAQYAAEAGLVRAVEEYVRVSSPPSIFKDDLPQAGSRYEVEVHKNPGSLKFQVPNGPTIPGSSVYFLSKGTSQNGTQRRAGALFTMGLEAFKVGALGDKIVVKDSTFDAYNSAENPDGYDPTKALNDLPLLASNFKDDQTVLLERSHILGDVFLGPGAILNDDSKIVDADKDSSHGKLTAMEKTIDVTPAEVPKEDDGGPNDDDDGDELPDFAPMGALKMVSADKNVISFDDGKGMAFTVVRDRINSENPFEAIPGSHDGTDADGDTINISISPGHWLLLRENGEAYYSNYDDGVQIIPSDQGKSLAALVFGLSDWPEGSDDSDPDDKSPVNPDVLEPGFYDTVTINGGFHSELSDDPDGRYIIKKLIITGDDSKLTLPKGSATFWVSDEIVVDGKNALANDTRQAPKMKVFYSGNKPVQLAGGSESYFTLVAKDADVNLASKDGEETHFFGALVGKAVSVTKAKFHFDTATSGIGTGTFGTGITLVHRHRL